MNGTSALILIEFIRCDIHAEVEIEIGQQVVQLRERLLAEVAELQQVVAVVTNQIAYRIDFGRLEAVERTHGKVLVGQFRLEQLPHMENIFIELLGHVILFHIERNLLVV